MIDGRTEAPAGFIAHDPAFADVVGDAHRPVRVVATDAHEGPVYVAAEDALYFTSLPRPGPDGPTVAIKRLALDGGRFPLEPGRLSVVRADANAANGMALGHDGALIVCEQGSHRRDARVSRVDPHTGAVVTVADRRRGRRLNSPNDVVVAGDGAIWFTDPTYGHLQGFRPVPEAGDAVLRHDPRSGETSVVADDFDKPNGLCFSPDGRVLYVGDSGANQEPGSFHAERPHHIRAFEVRGGELGGGRPFADVAPGFPDGLKVDRAGRVYVSSATGVRVLTPDGDLLGEIALPGAVNFAFGGADRDVLFITADTAVWAAALNTSGVPAPEGAQRP
jgi:gluconolactonase